MTVVKAIPDPVTVRARERQVSSDSCHEALCETLLLHFFLQTGQRVLREPGRIKATQQYRIQLPSSISLSQLLAFDSLC